MSEAGTAQVDSHDLVMDLSRKQALVELGVMGRVIRQLIPAGVEDELKYMEDHRVQLREYPIDGVRELWVDDMKRGEFRRRVEGGGAEGTRMVFGFVPVALAGES